MFKLNTRPASTSILHLHFKVTFFFKIVTVLLLLKVSQPCMVRREWLHSSNPKTSTPQNQPMEGRKREKSRRQKRKSKLGQWESIGFAWEVPHHQTQNKKYNSKETLIEIGTKVLWYWKVLLWGGANDYLWATKIPPVTRAGAYGKGNAPLYGRPG